MKFRYIIDYLISASHDWTKLEWYLPKSWVEKSLPDENENQVSFIQELGGDDKWRSIWLIKAPNAFARLYCEQHEGITVVSLWTQINS